MKTIVCKDYDEMSKKAAQIVKELIINKEDSVLGLATGSSPVGMYKCLIEDYKAGVISFKNIKTINLDEYYPIDPTHNQSYRYFMNENLFDHVDICKSNTYVPDGLAKDVDKFCDEYEALYDKLGGADIQILGIGRNGHIGFNEPSNELIDKTHLTDLKEDTIKANARFFDSINDVPTKAITMGIGTIMKAKKIIVVANGENKADAVYNMLKGQVTGMCPASMLQKHQDATLICDELAYSKCK
ncbi:MAG: glucosamine-6-phosphate deaminase [Clostridia bacterium]|nr:glucosamine-6-phosphate deaminase [Clostridia bacterium]